MTTDDKVNIKHVELKCYIDPIAQMLDEMAVLSEAWKDRRKKGIVTDRLRHNMIILSRKIFVTSQGYNPDDCYITINFKSEQDKLNY